MKKILTTLTIALALIGTATAQEHHGPGERKHFSPEEFQAKQRAHITEKAELTPEEADKFFPLYFELQKKRFEMEREARKSLNFKPGKEMTDEQCRKYIYNMADVKIYIAKLEKEYIEKYLKIISPCKLNRIEFAEKTFQRELMKKMIPAPPHRKGDKREKHEGPQVPPPFQKK